MWLYILRMSVLHASHLYGTNRRHRTPTKSLSTGGSGGGGRGGKSGGGDLPLSLNVRPRAPDPQTWRLVGRYEGPVPLRAVFTLFPTLSAIRK